MSSLQIELSAPMMSPDEKKNNPINLHEHFLSRGIIGQEIGQMSRFYLSFLQKGILAKDTEINTEASFSYLSTAFQPMHVVKA